MVEIVEAYRSRDGQLYPCRSWALRGDFAEDIKYAWGVWPDGDLADMPFKLAGLLTIPEARRRLLKAIETYEDALKEAA